MGYLTSADLKRVIQTANLNDIVGNDTAMITYAEQAAITEAKSYLSPKYDVSFEFTNTLEFNASRYYYYGERFILDATAYDANTSYDQYDKALYLNNVYYAKAQTTPGAFDPAEWELCGARYAMFYNNQSGVSMFDMEGVYAIGDEVVWKNNVFTCLKKTIIYDQFMAMQFGLRENVPFGNQFPNTNATDNEQWQFTRVAELQGMRISAGDFTEGDNRNQQLVNYIIDIMLYHLHARISPRNIPELRLERYDGAKAWLTQCAKGDEINAGLPRLTPAQGKRIQWGGGTRQNFTY